MTQLSPNVPVGIMASGTGSNFAALLRASLQPAKIVGFATDKPGCGAESIARHAGLPVLSRKIVSGGKAAFEDAVIEHFSKASVQVIALCGYMRLVSPRLIEAFPRGILNIHPSLLPAFPGRNAQQQAFEGGVHVAGCTIHLVDEGMDTGPILAQSAIQVLPDDTETTLAFRILRLEHELYAPTLIRWARGEYHREGRRMVWHPSTPQEGLTDD
jgi:phosphoribosylglycinamide formyltransferase-1